MFIRLVAPRRYRDHVAVDPETWGDGYRVLPLRIVVCKDRASQVVCRGRVLLRSMRLVLYLRRVCAGFVSCGQGKAKETINLGHHEVTCTPSILMPMVAEVPLSCAMVATVAAVLLAFIWRKVHTQYTPSTQWTHAHVRMRRGTNGSHAAGSCGAHGGRRCAPGSAASPDEFGAERGGG